MSDALRPSRRQIWISVAAGAVAAGLLLGGAGPMFAALTVANQLIDDGPDPGDNETMAEWDAWAFTPRNYALALGGVLLATGVIYANRRWVFSRTKLNGNRPSA